MLRSILGFKRDEVVGGFKNEHHEELHNLCSSPSIIRMIKKGCEMSSHVACMRS
jgi:hypothetical protein